MLPDCLSIEFDIGEDYFNLRINNPTTWIMSADTAEAQGKLVAVIARANSQLRAASQHCKHFTAIPYSIVIKPICQELEREFQNFRKVVESHNGVRDLYVLHGDERGFVRHWRYCTPHKKYPKFYVLDFCCLGGKCWFGPPDKYPVKK